MENYFKQIKKSIVTKKNQNNEIQYSLKNSTTQTSGDNQYDKLMREHFTNSRGTVNDKLNNFPRFVSRQSLSLFLAKNELFLRILNIHGSIVEAGVFMGGGLFTWAQLSSIYEPVNHNRKIIGFDSFDGFPAISEKDQVEENEHLKVEGYKFDGEAELWEAADVHNLTRPIGHIPKVELVKGFAENTIAVYLEQNPHLVVSLLYLDFDLYEPTKLALQHFLPRMPKGAVIAFDELNQKQWPGETLAVMEAIGLKNIRVERCTYTPSLSFAVIE